jgi:hypothetical protein
MVEFCASVVGGLAGLCRNSAVRGGLLLACFIREFKVKWTVTETPKWTVTETPKWTVTEIPTEIPCFIWEFKVKWTVTEI